MFWYLIFDKNLPKYSGEVKREVWAYPHEIMSENGTFFGWAYGRVAFDEPLSHDAVMTQRLLPSDDEERAAYSEWKSGPGFDVLMAQLKRLLGE